MLFKFGALLVAAASVCVGTVSTVAQDAAASRAVGVVESVSGSAIVIKSDEGAEVKVSVQDGTKVMRAAAGQTKPENASLSEIEAGDRVLAKGNRTGEGAFAATAILVMKKSDVSDRQQQELRAWQRGVSGVVTSVDPGSGDVKLKSGPTQTYTVHTSANTSFLRYAPDSTQFKDAAKSSIEQIKPGDQLRARGTKTADGTELTAEQVISGAFRNIAATVVSVDAAKGVVTVQDLLTKKPVAIKVTAETQLHQLPAVAANRIAMMLKGGGGAASGGRPAAEGGSFPDRTKREGTSERAPETRAGDTGSEGRPRAFPGGRTGGAPDLQQMLSRTPTFQIADLKKGDALLIVATEGGRGVALISGVEPLLTAAPSASAVNLLANWNLNGQPAGDAGGAQ
ncbi:MAG: hypothetical protein NVS9B15_14370 [Acidobacteriaceae bacterium]